MNSMKQPHEDDRDTKIGKAMIAYGRWLREMTGELAVAIAFFAPVVWLSYGAPTFGEAPDVTAAEAHRNATEIIPVAVVVVGVAYSVYRLVSNIIEGRTHDDDA